MAARLLSMDPLSLASTKRACAALANAMVPKEVTWSDAEMMLLAYRQSVRLPRPAALARAQSPSPGPTSSHVALAPLWPTSTTV